MPVDISNTVTSCWPTIAMRSAPSKATPPLDAGQRRTERGSQRKRPSLLLAPARPVSARFEPCERWTMVYSSVSSCVPMARVSPDAETATE